MSRLVGRVWWSAAMMLFKSSGCSCEDNLKGGQKSFEMTRKSDLRSSFEAYWIFIRSLPSLFCLFLAFEGESTKSLILILWPTFLAFYRFNNLLWRMSIVWGIHLILKLLVVRQQRQEALSYIKFLKIILAPKGFPGEQWRRKTSSCC